MAMCVVCPHGVWYACVIVCVSHDVADNLLFGIPILNVNYFQAKSVHGVCVCVCALVWVLASNVVHKH